jgi:hypothetical protein
MHKRDRELSMQWCEMENKVAIKNAGLKTQK